MTKKSESSFKLNKSKQKNAKCYKLWRVIFLVAKTRERLAEQDRFAKGITFVHWSYQKMHNRRAWQEEEFDEDDNIWS